MFDFYKRPASNLWAGILPLLYLIFVIFTDPIVPGETITPAFCMLGLLFMSFWLSVVLHETLSSFPDPLVTLEASGTILFTNRPMLEKLGLREKELRGKGFFELFSPNEKRGATISRYLQRLDGGKSEPLLLQIGDEVFLVENIVLSSISQKLLLTIFRSSSLHSSS